MEKCKTVQSKVPNQSPESLKNAKIISIYQKKEKNNEPISFVIPEDSDGFIKKFLSKLAS